MALITCGECQKQVSDKAATCPNCGAPVTAAPAAAAALASAPAPTSSAPVAAAAPAPAAAPKKKGGFGVGRLILWCFILGGGWMIFKMMTGSSVAGAVRGPETLFNETITLDEGEAMGYPFTNTMNRRVEVKVAANPQPVNVLLMTDEQWEKYNKVRGKLFGGRYEYTRALSRQKVLQMNESDVLPPGRYRIVVERPQESMLFTDKTAAAVTVIGY